MSKKESPLHWLPKGLVHSSRILGSHTTTAQVHPRLFTTFFSDKFIEQPSTSVVIGTVKSLNIEDGASKSIGVVSPEGEKTEIEADVVVIAAGPWTGGLAGQLLGEKIGSRLGVQGHRAHSIILKTKEELSATCLFTSMTLEDGSMGEPEVYARPDGEYGSYHSRRG